MSPILDKSDLVIELNSHLIAHVKVFHTLIGAIKCNNLLFYAQ